MTPIKIYVKKSCPYSLRAKKLLTGKGASFEEVVIDGDEAKRAEMMSASGGAHTVPQVFIGGRHIGGCDDLMALDEQGELDGLLGVENAQPSP